jgi:uncharacterized damage-inducible protein DinB
MYRSIADFEKSWAHESAATSKLLKTLTDASLAQPVAPGARTLGRLAWHITLTLGEMMSRTGLALEGPEEDAPVPTRAALIAEEYERAAQSLADQVKRGWSDETLAVEDDMYGEKWRRGATLAALILHQTHHRGQLTVLMRQAGLAVAGVYGPAQEEWAAFGAPSPAI